MASVFQNSQHKMDFPTGLTFKKIVSGENPTAHGES